mmetsp:Transcript_4159/g.6483  ORF Transcript_4159/g.6483 Transcript_4159/m.6483 type:complete len:233 (+) Transcript_4159:1391-2089(+)
MFIFSTVPRQYRLHPSRSPLSAACFSSSASPTNANTWYSSCLTLGFMTHGWPSRASCSASSRVVPSGQSGISPCACSSSSLSFGETMPINDVSMFDLPFWIPSLTASPPSTPSTPCPPAYIENTSIGTTEDLVHEAGHMYAQERPTTPFPHATRAATTAAGSFHPVGSSKALRVAYASSTCAPHSAGVSSDVREERLSEMWAATLSGTEDLSETVILTRVTSPLPVCLCAVA